REWTSSSYAAYRGGKKLDDSGMVNRGGSWKLKASEFMRSHTRGVDPATSRLFFTTHTGISDRSHLHFRGTLAHGPDRVLAEDGVSRSAVLRLADVSGLSVGDDVAVGCLISDEFIAEHGMTGVWQAFNGTWQPFFRRAVVAIDGAVSPARVTLDVPLRYAMKTRDAASLRVETGHLSEVGVEDLGLSNAAPWDAAWSNDRAHVLEFSGVKDAWVKNVASFASPESPATGDGVGAHLSSGGIIVRYAKRVTVADCDLQEAEHRGGGGNGYLYEVRQSSEILFRDCAARRGRHNFIQNWGFGVTGCVWLRCTSREGEALNEFLGITVPIVGYSEYHHSLATANLVDSCVVDDG
ncbi:MAG: hypothetical protein GY704_04575, partial [Phycisphaeraceae bacterium]|nr:hypothetical protein [Phycisphaeraceae bacterium]